MNAFHVIYLSFLPVFLSFLLIRDTPLYTKSGPAEDDENPVVLSRIKNQRTPKKSTLLQQTGLAR
jgi:hypothetical protein